LSAGPTIVGSGDPYYSEVRARIQSHIKYPVSFARKRLQGRVQVALTLLRNGTVEQLEITQPSGSKDLDQLALDSIREAAPFPVFQSTSDAAARKLELPIDFRLP
jgi:protein TonB